jgi:hypothetical protein
MECVAVVIVGLVIGGIVVALMAAGVQAAKKAYLDALERLKSDPHNPNLREEVLGLGRKYAAVAKASGGTNLFDEVALMNDINAACARAGSIPVAQPAAPSVEERLVALEQLRAKQLVTEDEYRERRKKLLDEV